MVLVEDIEVRARRRCAGDAAASFMNQSRASNLEFEVVQGVK